MEIFGEVDAGLRIVEFTPRFLLDAGLLLVAPRDEIEHRVGVVGGHDHARDIVGVVRRDQAGEWRDVDGGADVVVRLGIVDRLADRRIAETVAGVLALHARRLVGRRPQPGRIGRLRGIDIRRHHVGGVQAGRMRRVDLALEHLRPVAINMNLQRRHARIRRRRKSGRLEFRHGRQVAHVDPHKAAGFAHRIGARLDLVVDLGARRLGRHVEAVAVDVEFPAVIEAAQAAFFVAAQHQRGAAVRTVFVQHAKAALGIAECHEVVAERANTHRRAVVLGDFFGKAGRHPVLPHQLAHRRAVLDAAQEIVLLDCQHGRPPARRETALEYT